jgi:hypothetical protein
MDIEAAAISVRKPMRKTTMALERWGKYKETNRPDSEFLNGVGFGCLVERKA